MMNVLTLVMLPLACNMQWLFLFRWCVPTHFVFFLLLFFFSLSHTHTGPDDALLKELRQLVAIALRVLEKCTVRSPDYTRVIKRLKELRDAEFSRFPHSKAKKALLTKDLWDRVLSDRKDPQYDWEGATEEKDGFVDSMLAECNSGSGSSSSSSNE